MTDIKLTDADFKDVSNISGAEFYAIDEKLVKQILKNQEIVERLKLAISKNDGKADDNIAKILKEILGDEKWKKRHCLLELQIQNIQRCTSRQYGTFWDVVSNAE